MPTSASAKRSTTPARRAAVARKKTPKPKDPDNDIVVVSRDEEAGTFTAKLFGTDEEFTFFDDVNFLLLLIAYGGEGEDLAKLPTILKSLIAVDVDDADDADLARREVWQRFVAVLAAQRGMNAERSMKFINDIVAAAGKDQPE